MSHKTYPKMIVLAVNAAGEPEFFRCQPEVSCGDLIDGSHYDAAKRLAAEAGFSKPMIAFDMNDAAAKQLPGAVSFFEATTV